MNEVTQILQSGDPHAAEKLLPLVYDELRRLALHRLQHEPIGQTLQATALVHEAYLRLVDVESSGNWSGRGHFFGAAAEAMRRIMVEKAREKDRQKRGGNYARVALSHVDVVDKTGDIDVLALDEVLSQLESQDELAAQVVKLRYFAGFTIEETAQLLEVSVSTADREWKFAKTWLLSRLYEADDENPKKSDMDSLPKSH